ncbi:hypothetical protein ITI46_12925 [Streptomyces oryzae]|uniref:Transmembrane protein n=1 Tax=Streptomyces oryzae TaxID=1434886 RepID=A0ABS3XBT6_9ACTN|nr:hypothetical protein [Streptomyces oryzae]MBO8192561.1 hypothetical protein [Streptomyces oryzae]
MEASPRDNSSPADVEPLPDREQPVGHEPLSDPEQSLDHGPLPGREPSSDREPPEEPSAEEPEPGPPVEPHELRPQRKLRLWQLAPIVVLGALGSLMFAFPLAFEPGGSSGAVVSMLGLLLCGCAAGWGVMAARRVGHTWPGLPARGSGKRPDWRVVLIYAVVVCTLVVLAVWRVARLR